MLDVLTEFQKRAVMHKALVIYSLLAVLFGLLMLIDQPMLLQNFFRAFFAVFAAAAILECLELFARALHKKFQHAFTPTEKKP